MSLRQAVEQFNQRQFYACHDTLEALWMEARDPQRRFYQGLLQVAVAYYHWENGNRRGCGLLLGEGLHKLQGIGQEDLALDATPDLNPDATPAGILDLAPFLTVIAEHLAAIHAEEAFTGIPKLNLRSLPDGCGGEGEGKLQE